VDGDLRRLSDYRICKMRRTIAAGMGGAGGES
jgi:hypothetical protein